MSVVYRGYRRINGATQVTVIRDGVEQPLKHYVRHSPDGFEWGYGGSGPAELARCLLVDHFDLHGTDQDIPVRYQDFKADMICPLARENPSDDCVWTLSSEQIQAWVDGWRREQEVPA